MGEVSQPIGVKKVWLDCDPGMPLSRQYTISKEALVCCTYRASDFPRNLQVTMMLSPSSLLVMLPHVLVEIFIFFRHRQSSRALQQL